jgi:arsenical pump membrane protein
VRALSDAAMQAWPPFALVAGLLMIGAVAEAEGLFARGAAAVTRRGLGALAVLAGLLALDAVVTALLNLDTAAAFMTPVMVYAARGLGAAEGPFLYGAVLMANASSLLLPGANLTNLLVLAQEDESGTTFVARTAPAAAAAVLVTATGLLLWMARAGGGPAQPPPADPGVRRAGPGAAAVVVSAALVLVLHDPALPVLAVGLLTASVALARGELAATAVRRAVGPASLLGLLGLAVALGALAREWHGLGEAAGDLSAAATTGVAAIAAVVVNNLPAATLLSAREPPHPRALLLGLDLGPNLAVTGSLSALIWWRSAVALGARPSVRTYTLVGAPLAVLAMAAGLLALRAP